MHWGGDKPVGNILMVFKFIELNLERCFEARVCVNDKLAFPCSLYNFVHMYERYNKIHLWLARYVGAFCGGWSPTASGFLQQNISVLYFIEMCGLCAKNVERLFFGVQAAWFFIHSLLLINVRSYKHVAHFSDLCEKAKTFPFLNNIWNTWIELIIYDDAMHIGTTMVTFT